MVKIMFVCLGNICRSPMAEFMLTDALKKRGYNDFLVASSATSSEELGNPVHHGTLSKMREEGIPTWKHYATTLKKSDYDNYDFFLGMEGWNVKGILRIFGGDPKNKVYKLLDFSSNPRDIADPWYTGNFDDTFNDIKEGINCLINYLEENGKLL